MRRHALIPLLLAAAATIALPAAQAVVLEEFLFDDPGGTAIEAAANNAGTGNLFDVDADLVDVKTNGAGQLDASLKANFDFGTTYVDTADSLTGSYYGLIDFSYAFDEATYTTGEDEEIRISLIQFDPRSTFVTGEIEITRNSATDAVIFGNAVGTGAVDIGETALPLSGSIIAIVAANLDADLMQVHYSLDGGASFTTLTGGELDPDRGLGSLRLTLNNDFSDDAVLIDRIALYDANPYPGLIPSIENIPEPSAACLALVMTLAATRRRRG
ncbi:hypothetical protein Pla123a_11050 [Posidoniimonas polymericola]|uniref:PEP-CTERM protein-sorting domain-containing protein n=1 Tax=Posidoniimonas polymericola TaxID=2528002 RepID=A0A5C5YTI6_9BACT|nr:hypothetical protein [Posidoniimonas polymericola]TWT78314.1 hypothetical protein Pla123a_11050 [Posidoniimonas polymericola]